MAKIKENIPLLSKSLKKLKSIRDMEESCCVFVRDAQLKIVLKRIAEKLEIELDVQKPIEAYNNLRKIILESKDINNIVKLYLISKMC